MVDQQKEIDPREVYRRIPDMLADSLDGLSERDLDRSRQPGAWSIRQIVHHIVDADHMTGVVIKAALGQPGCTFDLGWYDPRNTWATTLMYDRRPIALASSLLRESRRTVMELLEVVPGAWQKPLRLVRQGVPDPIDTTVGDLIERQAAHGRHHIGQIRETRQVHGL